jgi:Methyltransferase domain.
MEENSLDFVFLNWLLMFLEDDETEILMNRIYKWLKPGGELFFRESCAIIRSKGETGGYYAHYRPLSFYDSLVAKKFTLIKEGHINTYLLNFADPLQCYWHSKKTMSC